jgi:hypothetical protein
MDTLFRNVLYWNFSVHGDVSKCSITNKISIATENANVKYVLKIEYIWNVFVIKRGFISGV